LRQAVGPRHGARRSRRPVPRLATARRTGRDPDARERPPGAIHHPDQGGPVRPEDDLEAAGGRLQLDAGEGEPPLRAREEEIAAVGRAAECEAALSVAVRREAGARVLHERRDPEGRSRHRAALLPERMFLERMVLKAGLYSAMTLTTPVSSPRERGPMKVNSGGSTGGTCVSRKMLVWSGVITPGTS